jgi:hypothetical protein
MNANMTRVVEQPPTLTPGAEWVVEFRALGQTWRSRSRVERLDRNALEFSYRSRTDDGNPSYGLWSWKVEPNGDRALVTVGWELYPATFWRRVLLARVRHRQLRRTEVPESMTALATVHARTGDH